MSLLPVDLQVILNQMSEVGRREKKREDKRIEDKQDKDDHIREKRQNYNIEIGDVDKIEISSRPSQILQRGKLKKKSKKKNDSPNQSGPKPDGTLKGNFLDIRE